MVVVVVVSRWTATMEEVGIDPFVALHVDRTTVLDDHHSTTTPTMTIAKIDTLPWDASRPIPGHWPSRVHPPRHERFRHRDMHSDATRTTIDPRSESRHRRMFPPSVGGDATRKNAVFVVVVVVVDDDGGDGGGVDDDDDAVVGVEASVFPSEPDAAVVAV